MNASELLFLRSVAPAAQASMAATGVPASVTIAQAIFESGWGKTSLATLYNNYFGIKATANADPSSYVELPTHEVVNGQSVLEEAEFARYPTVEGSFAAHAALLSHAARYGPAMAARSDPAQFAAQLQACGYSTNPSYAAGLIEVMNEFDLAQYDEPGAAPPVAADAP